MIMHIDGPKLQVNADFLGNLGQLNTLTLSCVSGDRSCSWRWTLSWNQYWTFWGSVFGILVAVSCFLWILHKTCYGKIRTLYYINIMMHYSVLPYVLGTIFPHIGWFSKAIEILCLYIGKWMLWDCLRHWGDVLGRKLKDNTNIATCMFCTCTNRLVCPISTVCCCVIHNYRTRTAMGQMRKKTPHEMDQDINRLSLMALKMPSTSGCLAISQTTTQFITRYSYNVL